MSETENLTIGLVLSAGGPTATAFHAGALAAVADETGWDARRAYVMVGTSAGASGVVMLRAGFAPLDEYARLTDGPLSTEGQAFVTRVRTATAGVRGADHHHRSGLRPPLDLRLAATGLAPWRGRPGLTLAGLSPRGTQSLARSGVAARTALATWPSEPTWIVTVRRRGGARAVFGRDDLPPTDVGTAVEASSAVPSVYQPVRIGGDEYLDGAIHSSTNADLVSGLGLDAVVIVSSMTATPDQTSWRRNLTRSYFRRVLDRERARLAAGGTPAVVIEPAAADLALRTGDFGDANMAAMAAQARATAAAALRDAAARAARAVLERAR